MNAEHVDFRCVYLPVSGSLKSGRVIALSCRLSAMALSNRLLPRPESLPQNTRGCKQREKAHPHACKYTRTHTNTHTAWD